MPKPRKGEKRDKFISRCMGDSEAKTDFPDHDQRLAFCSSTFENNMESNVMRKELRAHKITIQVKGEDLERKRFRGEDHLIVPAVLVVEGVLNDLLYPADELKRNPEAWNGTPIPINHPTDDKGNFISANTPEQLAKCIGTVFNARFNKDATVSDLWLNEAKLKAAAPEIHKKILDGEMVELSTGLVVEIETQEGDFQGNSFTGIARNHAPDHLALLPDDVGACSIEDGCGCPRVNLKMVYNQISHGDILQQLRAEIHSKLSLGDNDFVFIDEVFDDFAVFERPSGANGFKLLRQDFSVDDDKVELSGDAFEVRAKRTFEKVENSDGGADPGKANKKENTGGPVMDEKEKRVNALIEGPSTWTEDQRDFLTNAEDSILDRIEECSKVAAGISPDGDGTGSPSGGEGEGSDAGSDGDGGDGDGSGEGEGEGEDAGTELNKEKEPMTLNQHLDTMAPEVREVIERGLKLQTEEQDDLIKRIMANTQNTFTVEELKEKKNDELEKLANLARVVNFGGRAVGEPTPTDDPNAIPATPAVNWEKASSSKNAAASA